MAGLPVAAGAPGGGIEAVADEVQEHARHLLRRQLDRCDSGVEVALQGDIEARILGACPVIGEVERFVDEGIEVDLAALTRDAARMVQHALDDAVGAPAVLGDLFEIAGQHRDDFVEFGALLVAERGDRRARGLLQFFQKLDRKAGEIVDEVERVLISWAMPAVNCPSEAIFSD